MMDRRSLPILAFATVVAVSSACGPGTAPAGQPLMAVITRDGIESLREAFNQTSNQTRVILLLSPT